MKTRTMRQAEDQRQERWTIEICDTSLYEAVFNDEKNDINLFLKRLCHWYGKGYKSKHVYPLISLKFLQIKAYKS